MTEITTTQHTYAASINMKVPLLQRNTMYFLQILLQTRDSRPTKKKSGKFLRFTCIVASSFLTLKAGVIGAKEGRKGNKTEECLMPLTAGCFTTGSHLHK